jgi:hypothetical protein
VARKPKGRPDEAAPQNVNADADEHSVPQASDNRARAARVAKYAAMRKSGHRADVAHVYDVLVSVEGGKLRQPRSHAELAGLCNTAGATLTRILAVLENGEWITRTRGGGRGNPTTFATAIGRPVPPRPEPKTDAQRQRDRYWRNKAESSRESEQQTSREMSNNLTDERGTIRPEPHITQREETAGQPTNRAMYGSDGHQEPTEVPGSALATAEPARSQPHAEVSNNPHAEVSNKPAALPPNPIAAVPDAGAGSVKGGLSLDGFCHGSDNRAAGSGGTGPVVLRGSPADNDGGGTVPKYMGGEQPEQCPDQPDRDPWAWWRGTPDFGPQPDDAKWAWPSGSVGAEANR